MLQPRVMLGVATGVGLASAAVGQTFVLNELKASSSGQSKAYSVNSTGQVVGKVDVDGVSHSAHWLNDVYTDLHNVVHLDLEEQEFTNDYTEVFAISDGDQMVGVGRALIKCQPNIRVQTGMLLAPAVLSDLGTAIPGDALTNFWTWGNPCFVHNSSATAISNRNHVVGWSDVDGLGTVHAFIVTPQNGRWFIPGPVAGDPNRDVYINTLMVDLGTLSPQAAVSSASGVNDSGQVVGYSYTAQAQFHAFLVTPNGGNWFEDVDADGVNDLMQDLGTLGGNNSWARGINNVGQIVGESDTVDRQTHAFVWENGVMTDLGTLGGANSSAASISDSGVVVGWAETSSGERRACCWIDGQIHDLNGRLLPNAKPTVTLEEARDVNETGLIVGWGTASGGAETAKAFMLRVATDEEIAEAEADAANTPDSGDPTDDGGGTGGSGGSGGSGNATGGSGTTGLVGTQVDGATTDDGGAPVDGGAAPAAPALCGLGMISMLAPTLLGLGAMRRRRR